MNANRRKEIMGRIAVSVLLVVVILVGACAVYLGIYYHADEDAVAAFLPKESTWREEPDGTVVFEPQEAVAGLIFYPGGKVEHRAYIPLMQELSSHGILCVLVKMPFNLAVFDVRAADGIQAQYPDIEKWYIGGHSLGGSMAAAYLSDNMADYEGLLLLGSYSATDLSGSDLDVLSVFGSEDGVLNREKYEECKANLPKRLSEQVLEGGCHAYFGMYGAQKGDGTPTVSVEEQIRLTAVIVSEWITPLEVEKTGLGGS